MNDRLQFSQRVQLLDGAAHAAIAYDNAIEACANSPQSMSSFCSAEGDSLDVLYADWISKSRTALAVAAAPVQAQEPFAYMIVDESGEAYFGEFCVASGKTDLEAELEGLNYGQDGEPYHIVPVFRPPVQPVAVPDLISTIVIEVLEAARDFIGANAVPADAKGASESAHQARKMAALIDSVLAHLPAAPAAQVDAKEAS